MSNSRIILMTALCAGLSSVPLSALAADDGGSLVKSTPELVAKGKAVFTQNCVTCHGAEGKGDGPAAAALNPHPRNFISDQGWKFGRTVSKIFHTISNGSPGTGMAPFTTIPASDRVALAHYVRSLMSNPPADSPADAEDLAKQYAAAAPKPHISIEKAMTIVAREWEAQHPSKQ